MQHEARFDGQSWSEADRVRFQGLAFARRLASERLFVVVATLLAAFVRLPTLGAKSLWYDELISISVADHPMGTIFRARLRINASDALIDQLFTNNPPFHLIVIHLTRLVSPTDTALRFPFAFAGIATIPVCYAVLRRLWGVRAALFGSSLLAFSPVHIAYSQEARPTVLLVLLSLLGLLCLLKAFEGNRLIDWAGVVIFMLLDVWSSYFAMILVLPTLAVIAFMLIIVSHRRLERGSSILPTIRNLCASFALIALGCLPLIPDLLAVSRMNDASVGPGLSVGTSIVALYWMMIQIANPLPLGELASIVVALMFLSGVVSAVKFRTLSTAIALCWIGMPCLIMIGISSSHTLNARYVLASLPLVLGVMTFGGFVLLPPAVRQRKPRATHFVSFATVFVLFLLSVQGIRAYEASFIFTGPLKPDWRGAASTFTQSAAPDSCLITVDGYGNAFSAVVPYYVAASDTSGCSIDARDPRLLEVAALHPDLWWAIGLEFATGEQRDRLISALQPIGDVETFDFVVLVHPTLRPADSSAVAIERLLLMAMDAVESDRCRGDIVVPMMRESLANLSILLDRDPEEVVPLIVGFEPPLNDGDALMWDRAEQRLAWGNLDGARQITVRLTALYPGDPRAYHLLADIEQRAGNESWRSYARIADALPYRVQGFDATEAPTVSCLLQ